MSHLPAVWSRAEQLKSTIGPRWAPQVRRGNLWHGLWHESCAREQRACTMCAWERESAVFCFQVAWHGPWHESCTSKHCARKQCV